jgi:hypothetical protein
MKPWKIQKFFGDVVYDLRSRGLLPVAILLLVAMIAVPILVTRGGSDSSSSSLQPAAAAAKTPPEVERAVVAYDAGVRNYKKRLAGAAAQDPFHQEFSQAAAAAAASQLNSTVTTPTQASGGSSSAGTASPSTGTSTGTSSGTTVTHRRYLYRSVADISAGEVSQPLQRRKHIPAFTSLPNQVTPVMVYLGSSLDRKHAYFSISRSADQLTGQGVCAPSPTDCSLLVLRVGQSEDMVYSVDGKTYRVKINKITLNRIPLND